MDTAASTVSAIDIPASFKKTNSPQKKRDPFSSPRHATPPQNATNADNTNQPQDHSTRRESGDQKRIILVAKRKHPAIDAQPTDATKPEPHTSTNTNNIKNQTLEPQAQSSHSIKKPAMTNNPRYESRVANTFINFQMRGNRQKFGSPEKNPVWVTSEIGSPNDRYHGGRKHRHRDIKEEVEDPDANRKVLVSGFPPYTHSQDLARVLSELGLPTILRIKNRLAVVLFETIYEAQNAVQASEDLCIYGEFLEIFPYTNAGHVDELYRSFKRVISKRKDLDIIEPSKIDLSGDFNQQFENVQNAVRLTKEEVTASTQLYVDLEAVLNTMWPGCRAVPFGSIPTGLGIKSSDADCYVEGISLPRGGSATFVTKARRLLSQHPDLFTQLIAIPRANTPIVKFLHIPSKRHCDVNAKTPIGSQNSQLIKTLLEGDSRLAPLAVAVKYWAKVHFLSGTGRLTNYALVMMIIFYLQQPSVQLAPPVVALQGPLSTLEVDHWDAGFRPRPDLVSSNTITMAELLGGFFKFYSEFDFDKLVVCPLLGTTVTKQAFEDLQSLPPQMSRYVRNVETKLASPLRIGTVLVVQDPFELSHNVASSISDKLSLELRAYLKYAAEAYVKDREGFFRTILLTKPKPDLPSTKINLLPRVRGEIIDTDWRAVVRDILLDTIFANILKIKLDKTPEEMPADPKNLTREQYSGVAERPVWQRTYTRLANDADDSFIVNNKQITEHIINHKKKVLVKFVLELVFRDGPTKKCDMLLQLVDGDIDGFRGFTKFAHSLMLEWFRVLVRRKMTEQDGDTSSGKRDTHNADLMRRMAEVDVNDQIPTE